MIDTLTQFQWTVADGGYQVATAVSAFPQELEDRGEQQFVTNSVSFASSYAGRRYAPASGLFRAFAELKPEQEQILGFASRWGLLTVGKLILSNGHMVLGELRDLWVKEILDLSFACRLWEMIKARDTAALAQYIIWQILDREKGTYGVRFQFSADPGGRWIAAPDSNPELLATFQFGDPIGPAWHQLQYLLNEKLEGNVSARLLWNSQQTRLSLHQVPKDLISALWLQLARAIEGDRRFQQCEECRNWFEVSSADGGRADKRFCSTACRAREWRKKKGSK